MAYKLLGLGADPRSDMIHFHSLINAAKFNKDDLFFKLAERIYDVNHCIDGRGRTPLMWAAKHGSCALVKELLRMSADAGVVSASGETALTLAAYHGRTSVVELLVPVSDLEHVELDTGMPALHLAICRHHRDVVSVLLRNGACVSSADDLGNNALIISVSMSPDLQILLSILDCEQTLDVNFKGNINRTAFHWAVSDTEKLKVLLSHSRSKDAQLDATDDNGATPLLLALAHARPASGRLLVEKGCDISQVCTATL